MGCPEVTEGTVAAWSDHILPLSLLPVPPEGCLSLRTGPQLPSGPAGDESCGKAQRSGPAWQTSREALGISSWHIFFLFHLTFMKQTLPGGLSTVFLAFEGPKEGSRAEAQHLCVTKVSGAGLSPCGRQTGGLQPPFPSVHITL